MYLTTRSMLLYLILNMASLLDQLYKTKLRFAGLVTAVLGVGFLFLSNAVATNPTLSWLVGWPTNELGTTLLSAGVIAVIFEYYARKEADERTDEHLRQAIRHEAPAIRDAVLNSFAFNVDTLKDIASPETLDRIATNALALRLDDQALARDAYTDLLDQVIHSSERWRDVAIDVSLSPWTAGPAAGRGSMFVATVRWEYRVIPAQETMRFGCVADMQEYRELLRDPTMTSVWHFDESGGVDPASREAFELVQLSVNGRERKIRRNERSGSQLYTVSLGKDGVSEVTIAYTFRVLAQRHSHLLYLDLPRPTKGVHVRLNYADAGIRHVNVLDYFASSQASRVEQSSKVTPARTVDVGFDGWVFPRAGVAFVWVLDDEQTQIDT
jgi:hypothetical protein